MQAGTAVKYRVCSVHTPPVYEYVCIKYVPVTVPVLYINTGTGHFDKVRETSIPVLDTSVSSVR